MYKLSTMLKRTFLTPEPACKHRDLPYILQCKTLYASVKHLVCLVRAFHQILPEPMFLWKRTAAIVRQPQIFSTCDSTHIWRASLDPLDEQHLLHTQPLHLLRSRRFAWGNNTSMWCSALPKDYVYSQVQVPYKAFDVALPLSLAWNLSPFPWKIDYTSPCFMSMQETDRSDRSPS